MAFNPADGLLYGEQQFINQLFSIDTVSGQVTEYPIPVTPFNQNNATPIFSLPGAGIIPSPLGDRLALSCAIRDGADGNIYASNGLRNQLVQLKTSDKSIRVFQTNEDGQSSNPLGNLFPFNDLWTDKDGMWVTQTTGLVLQYFRYSTQRFTNYKVFSINELPLGVYVASDGIVYGCLVLGNAMFTFDPKTEKYTEYPLPLLAGLQSPAVVRVEKDGWVYFTTLFGRGQGRINMKSKKIELYPTDKLLGFGSVNTGPTPGGNGGSWMSFFLTNDQLARLDTKTLKYTYVQMPPEFSNAPNAVPANLPIDIGTANIAVNYKPGNNLYFSSALRNQVVQYALGPDE